MPTDLSRYLIDAGGKMLIYHGLVDTPVVATDTINYYNDMVDQTFTGSMDAAQDHARLFLAPGMGQGHAGPDLGYLVHSKLGGKRRRTSASQPRTVPMVKSIMKDPVSTRGRYIGQAGLSDNPDNWRVEHQCQ